MYAVFKNGSKQYKVSKNEIIKIEKINIKIGKIFNIKNIMLININNNIKIGNPFIKGIYIQAEIISHGLEKKINIFKLHRRKHFRKKQGHRQWFTEIKIINIYDIGKYKYGT